MLIIGLKINPQLFLPFEYRIGGKNEQVAVRYSLGWTVMGPVGGGKEVSIIPLISSKRWPQHRSSISLRAGHLEVQF